MLQVRRTFGFNCSFNGEIVNCCGTPQSFVYDKGYPPEVLLTQRSVLFV